MYIYIRRIRVNYLKEVSQLLLKNSYALELLRNLFDVSIKPFQ